MLYMKPVILYMAATLFFTGKCSAQNLIEVGKPSSASVQYSGINAKYKYSSAEFIIPFGEIKDTGNIRSLSLFKTSGAETTSGIDSVLVYMKVADTTVLDSISLSGYTLVFSGVASNDIARGWVRLSFSTLFPYADPKDLSVLLIRKNGTVLTGTDVPNYAVSFDGAKQFRAAYFAGNNDPWVSGRARQNFNFQYRPYVQLEID